MANIEGGLGSMVSTKETAEMERAIGALALEVPGEVWDDVKAKWHAARDSLGTENERLRVLIKILCSARSPFGSDAFQYARDQVSDEYRTLLLEVLS